MAPISRRRTRRIFDVDTEPELDYHKPATEIQKNLHNPTDNIDEVMLPGQGRAGPGCGQMVKVRCLDCNAVFEIEQGCGLRVCPRCYKKWARREAMAARDVAQRRLSIYPDDHLVHAVISFPGTPDQVFAKRKRAIKIAKKHNIIGFAVVGHHVRGEGDDWTVDGYLHYHILGVVGRDGFDTLVDLIIQDFIAGNGKVSGVYDWVFKVIKQSRGRTYWVPQTGAAIYKKFYYMLEHASIQHRRHALTWAGSWWDRDDIAANQVGGEGSPGDIPCPKCGGNNTQVEALGPDYNAERRYRERSTRKVWAPPPDAPGMSEEYYLSGDGAFEPGGGVAHVEPYFKTDKKEGVTDEYE